MAGDSLVWPAMAGFGGFHIAPYYNTTYSALLHRIGEKVKEQTIPSMQKTRRGGRPSGVASMTRRRAHGYYQSMRAIAPESSTCPLINVRRDQLGIVLRFPQREGAPEELRAEEQKLEEGLRSASGRTSGYILHHFSVMLNSSAVDRVNRRAGEADSTMTGDLSECRQHLAIRSGRIRYKQAIFSYSSHHARLTAMLLGHEQRHLR